MDHFEYLKNYFNELYLQNSTNISHAKNGSSYPEVSFIENSIRNDNLIRNTNLFYFIITLIVIVVGIIGNSLSLAVFSTKKLRNNSSSSCSLCLAALSLSDLLVIIFHVSVDWSIRGLADYIDSTYLKWANTDGLCRLYLYVVYVLRMNSVGLIVLFTVERYIVVCHPLRRNIICTKRRIRNCIISVLVISLVLSGFKPFISDAKDNCGSNLRKSYFASILDTFYGMLLTAAPFVSIVTMNAFSLRQLTSRSQRLAIKSPRGYKSISRQFGITMIVLSSCFVILNLPYFIVWCMILLLDNNNRQNLSPILQITRGIFYLNYCINFFLYSLTGTFFRSELKRLITGTKSTAIYTGYISRHSVINNQIRDNLPSEQRTFELL